MNERDMIFREQLIALTADLHGGAGRERELRRLLGGISDNLARQASVRDWAELKARADGPTYDSLLRFFQRESAAVTRSGDKVAARVFEILALSLIARRQYDPDLQPGIKFLDTYIEQCARNARKAGVQVISKSVSGDAP